MRSLLCSAVYMYVQSVFILTAKAVIQPDLSFQWEVHFSDVTILYSSKTGPPSKCIGNKYANRGYLGQQIQQWHTLYLSATQQN